MKLVAKNLRWIIAKKNKTIAEIVREVNALERACGKKRPMTRQALYDYFDEISQPPQDRMYMLAAVLGRSPRDIFEIAYDAGKYRNYLDIYKDIKSEKKLLTIG